MKRLFFTTLVSLLLIPVMHAQYQTERTGYDGDFFSLEGAIELFKNSRSLNDFERKLNSKNSYVNNLDLDYDGRIDYVRVEHRRQGDFHAIILQVPLDRYDVQDVAVIEIEKVGRHDAVLQIIGDPDLYGQEVVVEPYEGSRYTSGREYVSDSYVNVYYWPVVQRFYGRDYVVYVSPYRYNYYPTWWVSWRPFSWNIYYTRIRPYHRHCRSVTIYRTQHVHHFYQPHRRYSTHVAHRTERVRTEHNRSHGAYGAVNRNQGQDRYGSGNKRTAPSRDQNQDRYGSGIKRSSPSREINRDQSQERYGSGIKRSAPSGEINRQRETTRLESSKRARINGNQSPSSTRKSTVTPEQNTQRSDRSYRQTPSTRSAERSTSKVITPRRSGDQIKRNAEPRREAPSVRQRSSNSSSSRSYSKPAPRPKTNSIKRSSPSSSKSPRSSVKSNRSTPSNKGNAPSRSNRRH